MTASRTMGEDNGQRETATAHDAPTDVLTGSRPEVVSGLLTDAERIDRLAVLLPRLLAARYNWKNATPWVTRVAIDLAWQELQEERALEHAATRCTEHRGAFYCARINRHTGAHKYTRRTDTADNSPPPEPAP